MAMKMYAHYHELIYLATGDTVSVVAVHRAPDYATAVDDFFAVLNDVMTDSMIDVRYLGTEIVPEADCTCVRCGGDVEDYAMRDYHHNKCHECQQITGEC